MDKEKLYKLRSEATHVKPIVNVGKSGVTDQLIVELRKTHQGKASRKGKSS